MKKKMNWKIRGAMAACFALVLSIGAYVFNTLQGEDVATEHGTADTAPMVYVNDTLYKQSIFQMG